MKYLLRPKVRPYCYAPGNLLTPLTVPAKASGKSKKNKKKKGGGKVKADGLIDANAHGYTEESEAELLDPNSQPKPSVCCCLLILRICGKY